MTAQNLFTDIINPQIEEALRTAALGQDVVYDASLVLMPTEQGPQPVVMITLCIDGTILGQKSSAAAMVQGPVPPDGDVGRAVTEVYNNLLERNKQSLGLIVP